MPSRTFKCALETERHVRLSMQTLHASSNIVRRHDVNVVKCFPAVSDRDAGNDAEHQLNASAALSYTPLLVSELCDESDVTNVRLRHDIELVCVIFVVYFL